MKIRKDQMLHPIEQGHLHTLLDSVPALIAYIDKDLRYRYVNAAYQKWIGISAGDILGKKVDEILGPDTRTFIMPRIAKVLAGELTRFDYAFENWKGLRHVDVCYTPDFGGNGEVKGYTVHINDITDKKKAENELRESEERLKAHDLLIRNDELTKSEERYHRMIEEVQDYAIILLSKDGIIENWNYGAEKIKGYEANEVIGKSFKMFYTGQDCARKLPETLISEATRNGRAVHEGWRVRKDGSLFWGSIVLTALHDERDEIIGFSKVTRDLTERKAAEDALKKTALELKQKNKELENLSSFAYVSSHDLQEPLRKIQTFASRIVEMEGQNFSDKGKDFFDRLQNATRRMRLLIDDLLAYARAGTAESKLEHTDINQLLNDVKADLSEIIEEKQARIDTATLPHLKVVPFQFHQLFLNILSNALKFTKPGVPPEIKISAETVNGSQVQGTIAGSGSIYHHISIADNGIGFDPSHSVKMFEIFQRLRDRNEFEGTGVGLAICKKIVENHGGVITAEGEYNNGTVIHIYLPTSLSPN